MTALASTAAFPYALARACSESVWAFETSAALAEAILRRCAGRPYRIVRAATMLSSEATQAALTVYAIDDAGERIAFAGYVLGFEHDVDGLKLVLAAAAAPPSPFNLQPAKVA
jgi:hypothetical protein